MEIRLRRCSECGGSPTVQVELPFEPPRTVCPSCLRRKLLTPPDDGVRLRLRCSVECCKELPEFFVREDGMVGWSGGLCRSHLSEFPGSFDLILALPGESLTSNVALHETDALMSLLGMGGPVQRPRGTMDG